MYSWVNRTQKKSRPIPKDRYQSLRNLINLISEHQINAKTCLKPKNGDEIMLTKNEWKLSEDEQFWQNARPCQYSIGKRRWWSDKPSGHPSPTRVSIDSPNFGDANDARPLVHCGREVPDKIRGLIGSQLSLELNSAKNKSEKEAMWCNHDKSAWILMLFWSIRRAQIVTH